MEYTIVSRASTHSWLSTQVLSLLSRMVNTQADSASRHVSPNVTSYIKVWPTNSSSVHWFDPIHNKQPNHDSGVTGKHIMSSHYIYEEATALTKIGYKHTIWWQSRPSHKHRVCALTPPTIIVHNFPHSKHPVHRVSVQSSEKCSFDWAPLGADPGHYGNM